MRAHNLLQVCLGICVLAGGLSAGERKAKLLLKPKFDPEAARIDLFEGMESGALTARMVPRDEQRGAIFIENHSDQALTVELPEVIVGVHVLPQIGIQIPFPNGNGTSLGNNQQQQGQGQNQPVGGTANGNSSNNNTLNNNSFFSVPPERIARIEYSSVCLRHGAPEPRSKNIYQIVRVEEFSKDPRLPDLLRRVGTAGESQAALQAAAWHIANDMTWEELEGKRLRRLNAPDEPYFARQDLRSARSMVVDIETQLAQSCPTSREIGTGIVETSSPRLSKSAR